MASVFNATLHKYLYVANLTDQTNFNFLRIHIHMFIVQFIFPLLTVIPGIGIDFHAVKAVEENRAVSHLR
jgi:hypothetical protein